MRDGVKFHDGTDVTVDAVVWNLQRFFDDKSPQFDAAASAIVRSFVNMLDRWEKIDERHLAIYTKSPFSFFPYMVPTHADRQPGAMGEDRTQLGGIRQVAGRHRAVQDHQGGVRANRSR